MMRGHMSFGEVNNHQIFYLNLNEWLDLDLGSN